MTGDNNNRPTHEVRLGRIKAAIWKNETENGPRFSVAITRLYRTDERWESTTSFGRDDLPLVAKVADMAHTWIYQQNGEREEVQPTTEKNTNGRRKSSEVI